MIAAGRVAVIRLRAGEAGEDQYGEPIPGQVVESPLPPALFAPGGTSEPVAAGAAPVRSAPALARWPRGTVVTLHAATDPKKTGGA